jgi:hypothetical protein
VLYNILIEFALPVKLVRLLKIYLNETHVKVRIDKYLSGTFPTQIVLREDVLSHCLSTLLQNVQLGRSKKTKWD